MLQIHNTLSRRKEPLIPLEPGKIKLYVCGMTVYDYCHLGHARVMVVFDLVARYLRHRGYAVSYVRNITDIDDKIIKRAAEQGIDIGELTAFYIDAMHADETALGVLPPDQEPRATASIPAMQALIATLVDKGYAYVGDNGDVFYAVSRFEPYGRLSGRNLEELRAGERVDVETAKRDPLDFVLWKRAKPGEPAWESPWGSGRPGWHIECSAMSITCLGHHFDIHGGGMDLQFPHHENEIAQSEAATGQPFVNVWMHNGFVRVNEEKMSKSLGNFFTLREVFKTCRPEVVRFFILNSHYRSPLNYSSENLEEAGAALTRLYTALRGLVEPSADGTDIDSSDYLTRFETALDDDFNTPVALSVLFDLARDANRLRADHPTQARRLAARLRQLGGIIGLLQDDPEVFLQGQADDGLTAQAIETLIQQRLAARSSKNWGEADRIRLLLKEQGIILEDNATGTQWRRDTPA
ncbi:MAG: hypothetical protein RLZZ226_1885 [Pseudomonadota bacterium]